MKLRTCVHPEGRFIVGLHRPGYCVDNLRQEDRVPHLGAMPDGRPVTGADNFPVGSVDVDGADAIFEIPNAFPFRGATFISRFHADRAAADPGAIRIDPPAALSVSRWLRLQAAAGRIDGGAAETLLTELPESLLLAVATASTDPEDLVCLADACCQFERDPASGRPDGLSFKRTKTGRLKPRVRSARLFEILANNPHLPDDYKRAMVLTPGVQGASPVVGDWRSLDAGAPGHVYEYLRGNSYIPWGHYAANMADDAVRYHAADLGLADMRGMRHLYYQRTFVRLAQMLGLGTPPARRPLTPAALESLRRAVRRELCEGAAAPPLTATLWGWNYGFDYAPTGYRLHASHQQIHQQYALIPGQVAGTGGESLPAFACGDLVADIVGRYRQQTGVDFFDAYLKAVATNHRTDENPQGPASLVVHEDARALLFVPKAQTSQWELQLVPKGGEGSVLEAGPAVRAALDRALWVAIRVLSALGAKMVTTIEFSKRLDAGATGQRLLYSILPRLPNSPGAFSEAQLRWVNRHYPEDFAALCRREAACLPVGDRLA